MAKTTDDQNDILTQKLARLRELQGLTSEKIIEADLDKRELEMRVFALHMRGMTIEQIAHVVERRESEVVNLLEAVIAQVTHAHAQATPEHNFAKYSTFQYGLIMKLDEAIARFQSEKSTQFTSWVSAVKAQSDIFDKVFDRGEQMGVMTLKNTGKSKAKMSQSEMLEALKKERGRIDEAISLMEQTTVVRKKTDPTKDGKEALEYGS